MKVVPCPIFLQLEGAVTRGVTLDGGDVSKAATALSYANGAPKRP